MASNVETFVLELKEHLSGGMRKAAASTHRDFRDINTDIESTQRHLDELGKPVHLQVDGGGVQRVLDEVRNGTTGSMGFASTSIAIGVGTAVAGTIRQAANFAQQQIADVFSSGMEGSMTKMGFEVMAGNAPGDKLYGDLTKYIQDTIFGNSLYKDAELLLSARDAPNKIMSDLKMLAEVSRGDANRMDRLSLVYGQSMQKGKLTGDDLQQYQEGAQFNPLAEIAAMTGKKYKDLVKEMEKGNITFTMVEQAFKHATDAGGTYHDMIKRMSETPAGKQQAIEGNIASAKRGLGEALLPEVGYFFDQMKPIIDDLPATLERLRPAIAGAVHEMADLVKWTSTHTETLAKWGGLIKTGIEAYVAWRVGTAAMTAANWLWVSSVGAQTTATVSATTAIQAENVALAEQGALVEGLGLKWAAMSATERAAITATAANSANLPIMMRGPVGGINSSVAAGGAGALGALSSAAIPVMVTYFGGEALAQMLDANPFTGDGWSLKKILQSVADPAAQLGLGASALSTFGFDPMKSGMDALAASQAQPKMDVASVLSGHWWEQRQQKNPFFPNLPAQSGEGAKEQSGSGGSVIGDTTDAIVGGGRKVINIRIDALAKDIHNHFANADAAKEWTIENFTEYLLKALQSVEAAM